MSGVPAAAILREFRLKTVAVRLPPMTKRILLIGHPVAHSVSPAFQQAALDHYSLAARYEALDVEPSAIKKALEGLRDGLVLGANITVPHKESVVPLLDEMVDEARLVGAVNTIHNSGGRLVGHNTDGAGFLRALREGARFDVRGKSALVLGAGGSARAVCTALAREGVASIVVANRTIARAETLAQAVRPMVASAQAVALERDSIAQAAASAQLIVNCTSLGMSGGPDPDASPIPASAVPQGALVFDLVYNPRATPLLRDAAAAGARTLGGLSMLVYQGAASFELWTGDVAPVEVMFQAAEQALKSRESLRS